MRLLVTASFFGMALAHIINLGLPRYFPLVGILVLILVLGRTIYLPTDRWWYLVGCSLFLVASAVSSFLYGGYLAWAYVGFGVLNFLIYPCFERVELTNLHLAAVFGVLVLTCIPLGMGEGVVTIYNNPNNYSAVVFATMYFGLLLFRGRFLWQLGVFLLLGYFIFLGASRSIAGATLIVGILYFTQAYILKTTLRWVLVGGFVLAGFTYYSLITSDEYKLIEVIQANTVGEKKTRGLSHRDELFAQATTLIDEQPLGYGLGLSDESLERRFGQQISPHNAYLKIAVEGGVLALVGFLILVTGFWLTSSSPLASSFLFGLMVRGFFESATPLSLSLISGMFLIPMFLNENSVVRGYRVALFDRVYPVGEEKPS